MKYLHTKSEHYKLFIENYKTERLSKGLKITTLSKNYIKIVEASTKRNLINEEIFDKSIPTKYLIKDNLKYKGKIITFKTNSNVEYRLDILIVEEKNTIVNHIAFSLNYPELNDMPETDIDYETYNELYDKLLNKHEMVEVLERILFIIKELVKENLIFNYFCIGGTKLESKNRIYEYFLKVIVGEKGFEKLQTDVYPDTKWGLYFKI